MKNNLRDIGKIAGRIWKTLDKNGPLIEKDLIKKTRLNQNDFFAGVGWLARENKIYRTGQKYELKETNLTNKIGFDAGKIWVILNNQNNLDISSIAKDANIRIKDAYSAVGWLAREDKIINAENQMKYKLK